MNDQPQDRHQVRRPAISQRSDVAAFLVLDILREANRLDQGGHDVIHLEAGQPAAGAPKVVREAARVALEHDRIGYTEALGMPELRARIAAHYQEQYGIAVAPERVVVTAGSSAGFLLTFLACFDPGDRVGLVEPGYPAYRNILHALGIETVQIPVGPKTGWSPTPELVREAEARHGALDGLMVASPANPTGAMVPKAGLKALIADAAARGQWFLSDEIYHRLTFGEAATTALAFSDEAIVINSFSKYYGMTGWRLGWLIVPERLVRPLEQLAQHLFISPPTLSQIAALAAFDATQELDARVRTYADNRALLLEKLPQAGLDVFAPSDGTFYLYADVSRFTGDSVDFCHRALSEARVAMTPGLDFDPRRGHHFVRLSFAGATVEIDEAVRRLAPWLTGFVP